jgi:hypothetical protein
MPKHSRNGNYGFAHTKDCQRAIRKNGGDPKAADGATQRPTFLRTVIPSALAPSCKPVRLNNEG